MCAMIPVEKPYELIRFCKHRKDTSQPAGHHRVREGHLSGTAKLAVEVLTPLQVASGLPEYIEVSKNGRREKLLLLFPVVQKRGKGHIGIVPGTSLKGAARSLHEIITPSCIPVASRQTRQAVPNDLRACRGESQLCPTCRIFGAMGYLGHLNFDDAPISLKHFSPVRTPLLWQPSRGPGLANRYKEGRDAAGRKLYYHRKPARGPDDRFAIKPGEVFPITFRFENMAPAALGGVLAALGLHPNYRFPIKVGAGKPVGMGSVMLRVDRIQLTASDELPQRGRLGGATAVADPEQLWSEALEKWVDKEALGSLSKILTCEGLTKSAPSDAY